MKYANKSKQNIKILLNNQSFQDCIIKIREKYKISQSDSFEPLKKVETYDYDWFSNFDNDLNQLAKDFFLNDKWITWLRSKVLFNKEDIFHPGSITISFDK